jgi:hypothetical protein
MMKKTISASSMRPYGLMPSPMNGTASGACKARGILPVCAAAARARRTGGRLHEPAGATWEQLRSGLKEVLADLSVDGAPAPSGK